MSLHIAILYGSVREARAGIRVVRFLEAALRRRGHTVQVVDAVEQRLPLLDRMYKEYPHGSAPPVLEALAELSQVRALPGLPFAALSRNAEPDIALALDLVHELDLPAQIALAWALSVCGGAIRAW